MLRISNIFTSKVNKSLLARGLSQTTKDWPKPLRTKQHGIDILHDPLWNKSMAFTFSERDRLGLRGLLPPITRSIENQMGRVVAAIRSQPNDVSKNLYLENLHDRNETLFHRVISDHIEEMAPLIYTPTVGQVCQEFGFRFNRPRGMFFSRHDRSHFGTMMYNWPHDNVQVIVVTDGSRILGLGDLGVNGMGIPIGKLSLYCAAGGIAPHRVLPVVLDVGTNNKNLIEDPNYIGTKLPRLDGEEYYDMVDEFLAAAFARWPGVVVQFEDFETSKAVPLLEKYRHKYRVFNDDIQGTGCVTLAGLIASARAAGTPLTELRVLCAGAGSAGLGVCAQIVDGMVASGMTREEAMKSFVVFSSKGAYGKKDGKRGDPNWKAGKVNSMTEEWVNDAVSDGTSLHQAMEEFKPTVLLGLSTIPDIFDEKLIRQFAKQVKTPIIMPMSNPSSKCECTPEQAYTWSDGRAVVATGSPFGVVNLKEFPGKNFITSQCNNMYVFPGLGLAAHIAGVTTITDKMLYVASVAIPDTMTQAEIDEGRTFPKLSRIREVSHAVAVAVINEAIEAGLTTKITKDIKAEGIANFVSRKMYFPNYVPLLTAK